MTSATLTHPAPALLGRTAGVLRALASWLVAAAWRLEAHLAARKKARQDATDLALMSPRELHDIGLHEASLPRTADAWWEADFRR